MSYINQNLPPLQFPMNGPVGVPQMYNMASPPVLFNIQTPPHIQSVMAPLTATLANEVTASSNVSPANMYHYNLLSRNGFSNPEFAQLVATTADLIMFGINQGLYANPEDGIRDAASKARKTAFAMTAVSTPGLLGTLDPNTQNQLQQLLGEASRVQNYIQAMKSGQVGGVQPGMAPQMYGQPQQMYAPPQQNAFSSAAMNAQMTPGFNPAMGFPVQQPMVQPQQAHPTVSDASEDRYAYLRKGVQATPGLKPRVVHTQTYEEPTQEVQSVPVYKNQEKQTYLAEWRPTPDALHPVAITTDTPTHFALRENGNQVVGTLEKDIRVDRNKHQIVVTGAGQALKNVIPASFATREQALQESVTNLMVATQKVFEAGDDEDALRAITETEVTVNSDFDTHFFLEEMIFNTRRKHEKVTKGDTNCRVYQGFSILVKPVVCSEALGATLRDTVSKATTFTVVCNAIKGILSRPTTSPGDRQAILQLDRDLTKILNGILADRLSLPAVKIDSFFDDAPDLSAYLRSGFGAGYSESLDRYQKEFIRTYFSFLDQETSDAFVWQKYPADEDPETPIDLQSDQAEAPYVYPGMVLMNRPHCITLVNVLASELGVVIDYGIANVVQQSKNPTLYSLIRNCILKGEHYDPSMAHTYLVTSDNVIFELHKGLIVGDAFMISRTDL